MSDASYLNVDIDNNGNLILPPELLAQYGIIPDAQIKIEKTSTGFSISRSSDSLARVYVEPTNQCNLNCATCMRNVWDEPLGKMSQATFQKVIEGIESINPKPTLFFGGFGEPLTHPLIMDMVSTGKKVSAGVELITNGILLSEHICSNFIQLGLDRLWVSLDGATPESYADVRLGDMLPTVISNLETLQKMLLETKALKPRLGIAFVAMRRNIKDLPDVIDLGKRLGADTFSISNVLPHSPEMVLDALYVGPHSGEEAVTQWSPRVSLPRIELNEFTRDPVIETLKKAGSISVVQRKLHTGADNCPFLDKGSVSIRWDGEVAPCLALLHDNENYLDFRKRRSLAYSFGNIKQITLNEIWQSQSFRDFRRQLQRFDFAYCTSCNGCDMADSNIEDCYGNVSLTCGACLWAQGLIQCP